MYRRAYVAGIAARLIGEIEEEAITAAIHDLEAMVLSAPPDTPQEAALMLKIVSASMSAQGSPDQDVAAVNYVAGWIMKDVR